MPSWLTVEECRLYAPGIALDDAALSRAIAFAQSYAESPLGANRFLSVQPFTEDIKIPATSIVLLSRMPVVADALFVVEARSHGWSDSFARSTSPEWMLLPPEQYKLDPERGEVLLAGFSYLSHNHFQHSHSHARHLRPIARPRTPKIRVRYSTGFDFDTQTPEVLELKQALASIVAMRQSGQYQGLKEIEVKDESYRVQYMPSGDFAGATGKIGGSLIDELLLIFRKYRPRGFSS